MAKTITLDMSIEMEAYAKQVELFKQHFGESTEICQNTNIKHSSEFDVNWLCVHMLNEKQRVIFDAFQTAAWKAYKAIEWLAMENLNDLEIAAHAAYDAIRMPAWKDYNAIKSPAYAALDARDQASWAKYNAIREAAETAYEDIIGIAWKARQATLRPAWKEYEAITMTAYTKYEKERVRAFFIAYNL